MESGGTISMQEPANSFTQEILKIRPDWGATDGDRTQRSPPRHGAVQCAASGKRHPEGEWALANLKKRNRPGL